MWAGSGAVPCKVQYGSVTPILSACVQLAGGGAGHGGGLAEAQAAFAMLDAQMSRESQTAAKIGDRLHVSSLPCVLPGCCLHLVM